MPWVESSLSNAWPRAASSPISFDSASSIIASHSASILANPIAEREQCELIDAFGRILAAPIVADRDQPPFFRATRDGFALRASDVATGTPLRIVGQIRAGESWKPEQIALQSGEAIEIMTGAPLPRGADAVLMVEHAQEIEFHNQLRAAYEHQTGVRIVASPGRTIRAGENVVSQGSEANQGDILLLAGTRIGPEEIALAASCGLASVLVYPRTNVAVLATGDELREPSHRHSADGAAQSIIERQQIYNSNTYSLAALVREAHAVPILREPVRDTKESLIEGIRHALDAAPLSLITGGVSMGRYDLVQEVLSDMGAEFFFTGVKMRPGKPVVFGRVGAKENRSARFFFGLPGNPVSAMVTFRVFVRPLLAALSGQRNWQPRIAIASSATDLRSRPGLTRFVPAFLDTTQPTPTVAPIQNQGSGDVPSSTRANCSIILPEECEFIPAGQTLQVLLR